MGIRKDRLKKVLIWLLASMTMVVFIACGSSDDDDDDDDDVVTNVTISGYVMDPYCANTPVFLDANGNGAADADEPQTITDANGGYVFTNPTAVGPVTSEGCSDNATGLTNPGQMVSRTPTAGQNDIVNVSYITTLAQRLVDQGQTQTDASANVMTLIGLPSTYDAFSTNFIEQTKSADATQAQDAVNACTTNSLLGSLVSSTFDVVQSGVSQGSAVSSAEISQSVIDSLLTQSTGSSITNAITNAQVVQSVISAASTQVASTLGANYNQASVDATSSALAAAIASVNSQTQQIVQSSANPTQALVSTAAAQRVLDTATTTAQQVVAGTQTSEALNSFTDTTTVQNQIATEATQVDPTTVNPDVPATPATGSSGGTGD